MTNKPTIDGVSLLALQNIVNGNPSERQAVALKEGIRQAFNAGCDIQSAYSGRVPADVQARQLNDIEELVRANAGLPYSKGQA